jgi:RNA polymerase sigma-70 factor, ECF subfamily
MQHISANQPARSDAELVARLKRYEADAVSAVVARHGAALHRYVVSIVGDPHLAEDVVSETFLRMLEKIDGYEYRGIPFEAWLYRIAHNMAVNQLKRASRNVPIVDDESPRALAVDDDPSQLAEAHDERAAVRAALAELTEEQQQVVLLRYVAERSVGETARLLEKTEAAVKSLQFRALRSMGRLLGYGDE